MHRFGVVAGMVGMHTGGCAKRVGSGIGEFGCVAAALFTAACQNHHCHAGIDGAIDNFVAIIVKAVVRQIGTNVDQFMCHVAMPI